MFRGRRNETSGQFDAEYLGDVANNLNVADEANPNIPGPVAADADSERGGAQVEAFVYNRKSVATSKYFSLSTLYPISLPRRS